MNRVMEDEPAFSWLLHVERGIGHAIAWLEEWGVDAVLIFIMVVSTLVFVGTMLIMIGRRRKKEEY